MSEMWYGCKNELIFFIKYKRCEELFWMNEEIDKLNGFFW